MIFTSIKNTCTYIIFFLGFLFISFLTMYLATCPTAALVCNFFENWDVCLHLVAFIHSKKMCTKVSKNLPETIIEMQMHTHTSLFFWGKKDAFPFDFLTYSREVAFFRIRTCFSREKIYKLKKIFWTFILFYFPYVVGRLLPFLTCFNSRKKRWAWMMQQNKMEKGSYNSFHFSMFFSAVRVFISMLQMKILFKKIWISWWDDQHRTKLVSCVVPLLPSLWWWWAREK